MSARRKIASFAVAAALAASLSGAGPARASDSCRNPEWIAYCTCLTVAGIGAKVLPGSQWTCPQP